MKVLIANTREPFIFGGAEILENDLEKKLIQLGHQVDKFIIPFDHSNLESVADQVAFARNVQIPNTDLVIGMRYPAYLVQHQNKVIWLVHQYRQMYDLLGTSHSPYTTDPATLKKIHEMVKIDQISLLEAQKVFTISDLVTQRLSSYLGIKGKTLNLPPRDSLHISNSDTKETRKEFLLLPGRINRMKRQHLFIEALMETRTPIKLLIAGKSEDEKYLDQMKKFVHHNNLSERVKFDIRFLPESDLGVLTNEAIGVGYAPLDEDAYGLVTIEAYQRSRICLTLSDSGQVASLVKNITPEFVSQNETKRIAKMLDWLYENPSDRVLIEKSLSGALHVFLPTWKKILDELIS